MSTVLITGANRGIGLALTKKYIAQNHTVIAVCRSEGNELKKTNAQIISNIDLKNSDSITTLSNTLIGTQIDILINNAGQWCNDSIDQMDFNNIEENFIVNAIGTLRIIISLKLNLVEKSKIIIITSKMASISDNTSGGRYGYRMSKAALNAAGKSLSVDLKKDNIPVIMVHPGWVKTDMGGNNALITAEYCANEIIHLIEKLDLNHSGKFYNYDGRLIEW